MSRHRTPVLFAAIAALALALTGCGTESAANIGAEPGADPGADTPTPTQTAEEAPADEAPADLSGWITAEQMAATTVEQGTIWLGAAFLPEDASGEVDPDDLKIRYHAWTPPTASGTTSPQPRCSGCCVTRSRKARATRWPG